jgi:hypothetical protein
MYAPVEYFRLKGPCEIPYILIACNFYVITSNTPPISTGSSEFVIVNCFANEIVQPGNGKSLLSNDKRPAE